MDNSDLLIRPIKLEDLDALYELTKILDPGFTSLTSDKVKLEQQISKSINSFKDLEATTDYNKQFILVMIDTHKKKLAGISGILSNTTDANLSHAFKVNQQINNCQRLNKEITINYLQYTNDLPKSSELGSLCLNPEYRGNNRGIFLSLARFLFIASFNKVFNPIIMANILGVFENNTSPFWEAITKHFCPLSFTEATNLMKQKDYSFIKSFIPTSNIYLLNNDLTDVIAKPNSTAVRAKQILTNAGFTNKKYIDILDGGPFLYSEAKDIKSISNSKIAKVKAQDKLKNSVPAIVYNNQSNIKMVFTNIEENDDTILITSNSAKHLDSSIARYIKI